VSTSTSASLLRTPLFDAHVELGGRMVPFAGWEMPVQYKGITEEHKAVRTAAGLFDTSHMGELLMSGEYAAQVVNYLITNDASRLVDGQAL
jgi:aminomethyltransferase